MAHKSNYRLYERMTIMLGLYNIFAECKVVVMGELRSRSTAFRVRVNEMKYKFNNKRLQQIVDNIKKKPKPLDEDLANAIGANQYLDAKGRREKELDELIAQQREDEKNTNYVKTQSQYRVKQRPKSMK